MKARFYDEYGGAGDAHSEESYSGSDPEPPAKVPTTKSAPWAKTPTAVKSNAKPVAAPSNPQPPLVVRTTAKQRALAEKQGQAIVARDQEMQQQMKGLTQAMQKSAATNGAAGAKEPSSSWARSRVATTAGLTPRTVHQPTNLANDRKIGLAAAKITTSAQPSPKASSLRVTASSGRAPTTLKSTTVQKSKNGSATSSKGAVEPKLKVAVVQGSSIIPDDGEIPDPFVVLKCGGETHTTMAIEQSSDPTWDEEFTFAFPSGSSAKLSVTVFDFNGDGVSPLLIGEAETTVDSNSPPNQWRAAVLTLKNKGQVCGKVVMKLMREVAGAHSAQTTGMASAAVPRTSLKRKDDPMSPSATPAKPPKSIPAPAKSLPPKQQNSFEEGVIKIHLAEGRRMRMRGPKDTGHLFVVASLDEEERRTGTAFASKGSAKWNESLELPFNEGPSQDLWLEIFHEDDDEEEPVPSGCCNMPVPSKELLAASAATSAMPKPKWIPMKSSMKYGELSIALQYVPKSALVKKVAAPPPMVQRQQKLAAPAAKKDPYARLEYEIDDNLIALSEELYENCLKRRNVWREEVRVFLIFSQRFLVDKSTIYDQSGYGNHAKAVGRVAFKPVDLPQEPDFVGEETAFEVDLTTHFKLPILPSLDFDKQVTIEAWVKPYSLNGGFVTLLSNEGGFPVFRENRLQCAIWLKHKQKLAKLDIPLFGEDVSDDLYNAFGDEDSFTKQWHHYALTYDGRRVSAYIDGVCVAQRAIESDQIELVPLGGDLHIGKSNDIHYQDYHGQIAALRISSVALTKDELVENMQLGSFGALDLPPEESKLGTLRVTIVRCSKLDLLGQKPPSTYVECFVGEEGKTTRVVETSATPEWKDELEFSVYEESEVIVFHVWHHDPKRPIALGSATIPAMPDAQRNHRSEKRVSLGNKNNSELLVQLVYTPIRQSGSFEREGRGLTRAAETIAKRERSTPREHSTPRDRTTPRDRSTPRDTKPIAKPKHVPEKTDGENGKHGAALKKPAHRGKATAPAEPEISQKDIDDLVFLLGESLEDAAKQIAKAGKTKKDVLDRFSTSPNSPDWLVQFGVDKEEVREDILFRLNQAKKRAPATDVLRLKIVSGANLKDVAVVKSKDFYVQATLVSTNNLLATATIKGDANPTWDTVLDFDVNKWRDKAADKEGFLFQDEVRVEIRSSHGFGHGSVAGFVFSVPDCALLMSTQPLRRIAKLGSSGTMELTFDMQYIPLENVVDYSWSRIQCTNATPNEKLITTPEIPLFLACCDKFRTWTHTPVLLDQSGHGNNAEIHESVRWVHVGEPGRALDIQGHFFASVSQGGITVPYTPSLSLGRDFTCEVWANGTEGCMFQQDGFLVFPVLRDDCLSGSLCIEDQPDFDFEVEVKELDEWHHYALTFDGLSVCIYVDAKLVFTRSIMATQKASPRTSQRDLQIGNQFQGTIGGVQLASICKTSDQILYSMMSLSELVRKHKFHTSPSKYKGVAQVRIIEGIDLSVKDKVMTKITIGKESKQTKVLTGASPAWDQEFRIEMLNVPDLIHFEIISLGSMMSDKKRGSASVPIPDDDILDHIGEKMEMTVSLGEEKQGKLSLELIFTPFVSVENLIAERNRAKSIQQETANRQHEEQLAATHRLKSIQSSFWVEEGQDIEFFDVEPYSSYLFVPGTINITARKVENLTSKRMFSHKVSPFLKVLCGSDERTSSVKKNEDNPVFDHESNFEIRSATQIKFQIWDDGKRNSPLGRCAAMVPDQALLQHPNTVFSRVLTWGNGETKLFAEMMYTLDPSQADTNANQKDPVSCDEFTSLFVIASDRFYDQRNGKLKDNSSYAHNAVVRAENTSTMWTQVHQNNIVTLPFALGIDDGERTSIEVTAKSNRIASARFTHEMWARVDDDNVGNMAYTSEGVAFPKIEARSLGATIDLANGKQFQVSAKLPDSWVKGQWHHYALTFDSITACLFVDGKMLYSESRVEASGAKVPDAVTFDTIPTKMIIGKSATSNFNGIVGGVRVSCTPRTVQWLGQHFVDLDGEKQCNISNAQHPALGSLQVKLIRGESLVIRDISTRSSDPYVVLTLDGEQQQQSNYIKKNLNPEWNQEFRFNIFETPCVLGLHVWDKDFIGSDDDMGEARLHVPNEAMLENAGKQLVIQEVPVNSGKNGKLFLGLSWVPVDVKPPEIPKLPEPEPTKQTQPQRGHRPSSGDVSKVLGVPRTARANSMRREAPIQIVEDEPPKKEVTRDTAGTLTIKVKRGKDLVARDVSGTSDPYAILNVGGVEKQTPHISKNLNPEWNEEFRFSVDRVDSVTISLFDYNKFTSHRSMGKATCELPMSLLETPGREVDWWQSFEKVKYGQVLLSATFIPAKQD